MVFMLFSIPLALGWLIGSLLHLLRHGRNHQYQSFWWRPLGVKSKAAAVVAVNRQDKPQNTAHYPRPPDVLAKPAASPTKQPGTTLFHQVSVGGTTTPDASVRIPPRKAPTDSGSTPQKNKLPPTKPLPTQRPSFPVEIKITDSRGGFLGEARRHATRTRSRVPFVPFMQYWPTYADMTREQQAWYFYWRTELRNGHRLSTDTSYIFVHVYELLNLIGVPSPQAAFEQLAALWQSYRAEQPKLDNYLIDWIADFLVIHQLHVDPLNWYAQALQMGARPHRNEDLLVEAWLRNGGSMSELNTELMYRISGYSPKQSKFYKTHQNTLDFDNAFKLGLSAVDTLLRQSAQTGLFQMYDPGNAYWIKRTPFASAVHGYQIEELFVAQVRPWTNNVELAETVASILRQTENILRKEMNYRAQLRGVNLPQAWYEAIRAAIIAPAPKREIEIDLTRAESIRQESEAIRRRLIVEDEQQGMAATSDAVPTAEDVSSSAVELLWTDKVSTVSGQALSNASMTQRPSDAPDGLLTDLATVAQIMGESGSESARLLLFLRDQEWQTSPTMLAAHFEGTFVNVIFDSMNERAYDILGDALIFAEGEEWVVADDYRDEIAYILDHPDYQREHHSDPLKSYTPRSNLNALPSGFDVGWTRFAEQLQPVHWISLAIIVQGYNVEDKLDVAARSVFSTVNQVVDNINEIALESVGDTVIDTSMSPIVIEEYRDSVDILVNWAIQSQKIEVAS
jgi:hypothetical protein